jgi:hypothetical protein
MTQTQEQEARIYRIMRVFKNGRKPRTLHTHVTLSVARLHCKDPRTKGDGWFDCYDYAKGCAPKE